jgi:hypothetical protein
VNQDKSNLEPRLCLLSAEALGIGRYFAGHKY